MRRTLCLAALAAAVTLTVALPATASTTQPFNAQFTHDTPCGPDPDTSCGDGILQGFGQVTTTIVLTGFGDLDPDGCLTVTAERFPDSYERPRKHASAACRRTGLHSAPGFLRAIIRHVHNHGRHRHLCRSQRWGTLFGVVRNHNPVHYRGMITLP